VQQSSAFSLFSLSNLWLAGVLLSVVFFGIKLNRIFKLKRIGAVLKFGKFSIIKLPGTTTAFSFFRDIFLGEDLSEEQQQSILLHEKVHVAEKHSWDLLLFELLRVLLWFNPLVYVFQKRMTTLQEYIADKQVAAQKPRSEYYQELLSQVFQTTKISFINTFFNRSLIKNRIVMLQKSKSKKILQLKYLLILPVVAGMLLYTSCSNESGADNLESEASLTAGTDSEVMTKITELSEAIMKKGNLTDEEKKALDFLAQEAKPGDKIYESVHEYLEQEQARHDGEEYYLRNLSVDEKGSIPYSVIDKSPLFPGCEGLNQEAAKKCTTKKIGEHVGSAFNTKIGNELGLYGKSKIFVQFKIDDAGNIVNVRARGPHQDLEAEATRVVKTLPQMIPGEHKGKKVAVMYSLPIIFEIEE